MVTTEAVILPVSRREFREWLRSFGYPRRLCVRLAAAWPDEREPEPEDTHDDDEGAAELLEALRKYSEALRR